MTLFDAFSCFKSKHLSLNGALKVCISHDLWKKCSILTLMFVFMSLICACLLPESGPKVLLDLTKETTSIIALEKIHIIWGKIANG